MVEYLYLLDYDPIVTPIEETSSRDSSDTMSVRTDPGQYGLVYGQSAVSAFGGPAQNTIYPHGVRARTDSSLTAHALPTVPDYANFSGTSPSRRRKTTPPNPSPLATKDPHLVLHARMYAAGERYGISGLKALSLDKFKIQATRHWDSDELAEAIHIVYTSTPKSDRDMREAVANTLEWHGRLLEKPEVEIAIMEFNGLAFELLKRSRRAEPEYD